jgi:hypothetical protein
MTSAKANQWTKWTDEDYLRKLLSMVKQTVSGCWEKQGFRHKEGYGTMSYRGKGHRAHVLAFKLMRGPVPSGMVVMHMCDNPPCCNPAHLKLGTRAENNKDMHAKGRSNYSKARKTKCKHGHEFTAENTRITREGFRACKACARLRQRPEYKPAPRAPLTADQLRQQRYRIRRKQRLASQNVQL